MFKSHAQRNHCLEKVKSGEMTQKQFDAYDEETPKNLPVRAGDKTVKPVLGARSIPKPRSVEELRALYKKK